MAMARPANPAPTTATGTWSAAASGGAVSVVVMVPPLGSGPGPGRPASAAGRTAPRLEGGPHGPLHLVGEHDVDRTAGQGPQSLDQRGQLRRAAFGQAVEADPVGDLGDQGVGPPAEPLLEQGAGPGR